MEEGGRRGREEGEGGEEGEGRGEREGEGAEILGSGVGEEERAAWVVVIDTGWKSTTGVVGWEGWSEFT